MLNGSRDRMPDTLIEIILRRDFQVLDDATLKAHEMIVLINKSIVTPGGFAEIQFSDLPLLLEDVEISVHRTEGDLRHLLPNAIVHPFSSRV